MVDLERGTQSQCARWCIATREHVRRTLRVWAQFPRRYQQWCTAFVVCLAVTTVATSPMIPTHLVATSGSPSVGLVTVNASAPPTPPVFQQVDFGNREHTQRVHDALGALRKAIDRDGWHCLSALNVDVNLDLVQVQSLVLINPTILNRSSTNTSLWEVSPFAPDATSVETSRSATVTVEYASMSGRRQSQTFGSERWCSWSWCPVEPATMDSHCLQHLIDAHATRFGRSITTTT